MIKLDKHVYSSLPNGGIFTLSIFEEEEKEEYVYPSYGGGVARPSPMPIEPIEEPMIDEEPMNEDLEIKPVDRDEDIIESPEKPEIIEPEKPEEPEKPQKAKATNNIKLERQVFIPPKQKQEFTVSTRKTTYSPGDLVEIDVNLTSPKEDEVYYASLTVTDLSSYVRVPSAKHPPSLAAMAYLEKEVMHLNKQVDEFPYANEYLDNLFQTMRQSTPQEMITSSAHVDLLLGAQAWRKFLFDDDNQIWNKISSAETDDEKLSFKYIQVGT